MRQKLLKKYSRFNIVIRPAIDYWAIRLLAVSAIFFAISLVITEPKL